MHLLLEMHYDSIYEEKSIAAERPLKKQKRDSEYKLIGNAANTIRRGLNQQIRLPNEVRHVLCEPGDEQSWDKLEQLRRVVAMAAVDEDVVAIMEADEAEMLAKAIEACDSNRFADEVGEYPEQTGGAQRVARLIPPRSRVLLDITIPRNRKAGRTKVAAAIRKLISAHKQLNVRVQRWPFVERLSKAHQWGPLVMEDAFGKAILAHTKKDVKEIAESWRPKGMNKVEVLDSLLLVLHDALFLKQAVNWSRGGVANLASEDALDLAHWFIKGQAVGKRPIFDGICAFCGAWLHGDQNQCSALSNKATGKPVNRDGKELPLKSGHAD
ncbi:MAG: hypothetical protein QGI29_01445, partial [Pirellulales bacterium]|nr:hypothetical protein [Pirellulales bacterium]